MNLVSKLRKFLPQQSSSQPTGARGSINLDPFLQGQEVSTPFGPCYVKEKYFPLAERHDKYFLKQVLGTTYDNLYLFGQSKKDSFRIENALFLDTETTGLAGGTGTYAFLVGLGFFTPTHFVVKQLLMRDYNEELALLYLLDQELRRRDTIISFNGKSFDLPLLQTRFTLSRLGLEGPVGKHHLDLLHMSRRLWRHKLESCSLGSLEEHILGVRRTDDIPGFEIPQRYFDFLQTGDGSLLVNILEHNVIDIISMATLLFRIHLTTELEPAECDCPYEAEALASLALVAEKQRLALHFLEAASQLAEEQTQYVRVIRQSAAIYKRLKEYEQAALLWKKLLKLESGDLAAAEELAKYYEHRAKDLSGAEQVTRRALAIAWQSRSPKIPALEHRLKRIQGKRSVTI
ncbi:MAG: hypothetical protein GX971_11720 [Firmicutes bacterium]|nr:hypothetical protein [Bacillota bacterium]